MLFTKSFVCDVAWEHLARAFYSMYPSRHYPHVRDVHIIDHELLPERGQLRVRRIGRVKYNLPSIVHYIAGPCVEYALLEDSVVDLKTGSLSQNTIGLTMQDCYTYRETATLQQLQTGDTEYKSTIDFKVVGFGFFNYTLEAVASRVVAEFSKNDGVKKAILEAAVSLD
ncbi:PRELI family protein [Babesia caballi]|uniref:PRELI family protein n=1 Tax=Babesia caballi TaxID=5871 RepID=A0AAV4LZD7_BABCB|nr:PRELI family protein [Babesia caballi]